MWIWAEQSIYILKKSIFRFIFFMFLMLNEHTTQKKETKINVSGVDVEVEFSESSWVLFLYINIVR